MGRSGHSALIIGISASAVLAAGIGVSLTRGDGPAARAETTLGPVRDARVVSANGESLPAHAGATLAPGDVITTGPDGNAQLLTRGRLTLLTSNAVLAVQDGVHQQLRTGTAVIDAQEGPGLTLDIAGDTLVVPSGSATEADRSTAVRIGSLAGPASVTNGTGRRLTVAALWQVIVNGDALPSRPTPLQLSDVHSVRDAEATAVPELVADNLAMKALARGINSTGNSTARIVEAAWTGTLVPRGPGVSRSDQVLPAVIADATPHAGGTPQQRYDKVVGWRAEGGSWGVVVHLLSARATQVAQTLHSLQLPEKAGTVGNISAHGLRVSPPISSGTSSGGHTPTGTHTTPPIVLPTTGPSTPPVGGGPKPKPGPTPSPTLLGGIVGTVGTVLNDLLSLLPTDTASATPHVLQRQAPTSSTVAPTTTAGSPTPAPSDAPTSQAVPTPTPTSSGLVDDLLGGVVGGLSGQ